MTQPDTIAKSIRVDLKTDIPYWLIIFPGIFVFGVIKDPSFISAWPLMVILAVFVFSYSVLSLRLTSIEVDAVKGKAILTETNVLKKKRVKSYPLSELQFTYKTGKPGLYHRIVNICRGVRFSSNLLWYSSASSASLLT